MSSALLRTGRPMLFSCDSDELILHEDNDEYPAQWAPSICNIARINWDIWVHHAHTTQHIMHSSQLGHTHLAVRSLCMTV